MPVYSKKKCLTPSWDFEPAVSSTEDDWEQSYITSSLSLFWQAVLGERDAFLIIFSERLRVGNHLISKICIYAIFCKKKTTTTRSNAGMNLKNTDQTFCLLLLTVKRIWKVKTGCQKSEEVIYCWLRHTVTALLPRRDLQVSSLKFQPFFPAFDPDIGAFHHQACLRYQWHEAVDSQSRGYKVISIFLRYFFHCGWKGRRKNTFFSFNQKDFIFSWNDGEI